MKKILSITVTVMSLMFLALFIPTNSVHAADLPEYCSDATGSVVCEITILPYSQPGSYSPEIAEIPEGASVVFINSGPEIHTATSTDAAPDASPADASSMVNGLFDTGIVGIDGVSEPITLNDNGIFYYYCAVHPDMMGTLIVGDKATAKSTSTSTTETTTNTTDLEFSTTASGDTSITGGELPLTKIKSIGNTAYIIDGTTPKGGHDAFSYDGSGHKKITGNIQVDLDPVTNTGSINAEWTDPEGNNWTYKQTKFAGGNEMYIGETHDGTTQTKLDLDPIAINHFEHGTTGAGPTIEPTLFVYLAAWGPAEVFKNDVSEGTFETHMMITEGARDVTTGKIFQSDGTTPYSPMMPDNSAVNHNTAQIHLVYHTAPAPEMTANFPPPFEVFEHTMFYDIDVLPPTVKPSELKEPTHKESTSSTSKMSPHAQMKHGVEPADVECRVSFELVMKISDGSGACVHSNSIEKLVELGWAGKF